MGILVMKISVLEPLVLNVSDKTNWFFIRPM